MAVLALVLGFALVWGSGAMINAWLLRGSTAGPGTVPLIVGSGWFTGAFLLTLVMRASSLAGIPFSVLSIAAPLALILVVLAWLGGRSLVVHRAGALRTVTGSGLPGWQRVLWLLLCVWLATRFALLLADVVWRPLYPWDAWTQWSTKARVWFELRAMAPFVDASRWLAATAPNVYFDAAPHYPGTVPLLQVWAATLLGRWDDTLVNLPWWLTAVAFGLAVYGFLAQDGFQPLPALIGTWLVLSLPILDVHVALAGYADLPMATYLTLGALFSLRAARSRRWGDAAIAALLLGACVLIKNPGKVWVVTLIPGLLVALWPDSGRRIALASVAGAICLMLVLAQTEPVLLGYRLHLDFDMPWSALADAYFAYGNWHLLWYGSIAVAILAWRRLLAPDVAPYTLFVAAGLLFLMFGFAFTNARVWVEDQSTVNRATLHLAPLVIVWMLMVFRAWSERRPRRELDDASIRAQLGSG